MVSKMLTYGPPQPVLCAVRGSSLLWASGPFLRAGIPVLKVSATVCFLLLLLLLLFFSFFMSILGGCQRLSPYLDLE